MTTHNPNSRLETFCDGVFAIAMTLLIIDIRIPHTDSIKDTNSFWLALKTVAPSVIAFVLSFIVIFITWVNHHNTVRWLSKTSTAFIYSNGFLLLTVVFVPFPTSLLGEHIFTDHAAPAVVLYDATLALQALGWVLIGNTAIKNHLTKNERSKKVMTTSRRFANFALVLYSLCTVIAIWFPLAMAIITVISWLFWLIYGFTIRHEEVD